MMFLRTIGLACLVCLSAVVSSLSAEPGEKFSAPLRAWDTIVSPTLFADIANFDRDIRHEAGERLYAFQTFDAAGKLLLSVAIAIAPAGSRLPQDEWKAAAANADPPYDLEVGPWKVANSNVTGPGDIDPAKRL